MTEPNVRMAVFTITPKAIVAMFQRRAGDMPRVIEHGLPPDAEVVQVHFDDRTGLFKLYLTSKEFPETRFAEQLPHLDPPVVGYGYTS